MQLSSQTILLSLRRAAVQRCVSTTLTTAAAAAAQNNMSNSNDAQQQPETTTLKPGISTEAQQEQQVAGVGPAKPTGTLQDEDPNLLVQKRNQILWEQAQRGEQPGLTLMQDALADNKAKEWGNEPTIMEPDNQN